ncbi:glycosyltransferase family A protein [Azospirillum thiophilum]|nr:glycosyltransferase family A protein [Azospirillum thiophilum]
MSLRIALFQPEGAPFPDELVPLCDGMCAAGWELRSCRLTRDVEACRPDVVLSLAAETGKRTGHPWLGVLHDDPGRLRRDRRRLDAVLSQDGWLTRTAEQAAFLTDSLVPTDRPAHLLPLDGLTPPALAGLLEAMCDAAGFATPASGPSVDYIVRVGGRSIDFVRRCLDSLGAQTAPGVGAIIVRHAPVPGLDAELERLRPRLRRLILIDGPASATRSACLWAGLTAVEADLFGMLDDDDALHPNHVASLAPFALAGSLAITGAVQVWDDASGPVPPADPRSEHRTFHAMPPPDRGALFLSRIAIHSSAFLAPSALLASIGPDPGLDFAEDTWLIRRLARLAPLASSWRVSTDFHWRQGGADNTAFRADGREEAMTRIADRERLDPIIAALRWGGGNDQPLPLPPAWGQPADRPDLPSLSRPQDFHALPGGRPLYVYGSGGGGRIVLGEVSKHPHLTVTAVLDSSRPGLAFGLPVLRPADLPPDHLRDGLFIIASEHVVAMTATLHALGVKHIYDAGPHIRLYTELRQG